MPLDQLFLRLYSFQFILLLLCALAYFKAAEMEDDASSVLWAGLSVAVFVVTWLVLGWSFVGNLGGQAGLLVAITLWRLRK
jgi:hypothetical protein